MNIWKVRKNQNESSELKHYGVKGMKWGVRKEYEKKGRKRNNTVVGAKPLKYSSLELEKTKQIAKHAALQTLALIDPTGLVALTWNTQLIAKIGYESMQSNEKFMKKDGSVEKLSDIKKKTVTGQSMEEDSKFVNSGSKNGRRNNCMCCVTTLEMRQRGYDVQARRRTYGYATDAYKDWFEDVKIKEVKTTRNSGESRKDFVNRGYNNLTKELEKYPNKSRGFIAFSYEGTPSAHTISWEVKDGSVSFYDAQGGSTTDKVLSFSDQTYSYGRLDNCKLKPAIAETVVSRGKKNG